MSGKFLRIIGCAKGDRNHTITVLRNLIDESGGWILDFKFFSNEPDLRIEVPAIPG
jgi:hypothetical protein